MIYPNANTSNIYTLLSKFKKVSTTSSVLITTQDSVAQAIQMFLFFNTKCVRMEINRIRIDSSKK